MYLKYLITILIILLIPVAGGCMSALIFSERPVLYSELDSHMEYTIEGDIVTIRSISFGTSVSPVGYFKIKEKVEDGYKIYYLTYFLSNKKKDIAFEWPKWGIRLRLKFNNFNDRCRLFYKDKKGIYEIHKGTKNSWKQYFIEGYKKWLSPKQLDEMLDDI